MRAISPPGVAQMSSEYVDETKKDSDMNYEYGKNSECSKNSPSRFNNRYALVLRGIHKGGGLTR